MQGSWHELRDFLQNIFHSFQPKGPPRSVPSQWQHDAIAKKTGWDPHVKGGINSRSHKLVESGQDQLRIKATACFSCCTGCFAIPFGLMLFGVGAAAFSNLSEYGGALWGSLMGICCLVLGSLLVLGALLVIFGLSGDTVICRQQGCLWKRGLYGAQRLVDKDSSLAKAGHDRKMPLEEVYAVQLLSEFVSPDKFESYMIMSDSDDTIRERNIAMEQAQHHSYELNLVLRTGERITVMDQNNQEGIKEAGHKIGQFLGIHVWDLI